MVAECTGGSVGRHLVNSSREACGSSDCSAGGAGSCRGCWDFDYSSAGDRADPRCAEETDLLYSPCSWVETKTFGSVRSEPATDLWDGGGLASC